MPKVVYRPQPGGQYFAPGLRPGAELEVSHREAEYLLSTGAFEAATPTSDQQPETKEEPAAKRSGRKETA